MDLVQKTITARIKAAAIDAGFQRVGIAPVARPAEFDRYLTSLQRDYHGQMAYLARPDAIARREDPTRILPDARSIICVAAAYDGRPDDRSRPSAGRVARYARGPDYHDLLGERLERVAREVRACGGEARWYTDTGPVCEVAHAARAGIGWIGKNTLLLSERGGSWYLLGELLCTLDLEPDEPQPDRCGSCTRCLDACPTGAFPAPYVLDARRCISYLTIELRGSLPNELRRAMGDWVFGCDVCQEVCPWSARFPPGEWLDELSSRPEWETLDPVELLGLDDAAFAAAFRGTPLKRAKRRGLLRNACVALGNARQREAVPALVWALADPESLVRGHAAWALAEIGGATAERALRARRESEPDPDVRAELADAIDRIETTRRSATDDESP